jgi:hypothetical protein
VSLPGHRYQPTIMLMIMSTNALIGAIITCKALHYITLFYITLHYKLNSNKSGDPIQKPTRGSQGENAMQCNRGTADASSHVQQW